MTKQTQARRSDELEFSDGEMVAFVAIVLSVAGLILVGGRWLVMRRFQH
jgi:hypothetical protein